MKQLLIISAAIAVMLIPQPGTAQGCGIPPIAPVPPVGCRRMVPVCQCDSTGKRCSYVFVCQK